MIGALDMAETVADGAATIRWLASPAGGARKVGVVGFCWGGAMVNRLAVAVGRRAQGRRLLLRPRARPGRGGAGPGGDADHPRRPRRSGERTARPWAEALRAAGKDGRRVHEFPNVDHAFHNDTSAARYNREAADAGLGGDARFLPPAPAHEQRNARPARSGAGESGG